MTVIINGRPPIARADFDTLAELNAIVTDATLDTSSAARTPSAHAINGAEHTGEGDSVTKSVGTGAGDVAAGTAPAAAQAAAEATAAADATSKANAAAAASDPAGTSATHAGLTSGTHGITAAGAAVTTAVNAAAQLSAIGAETAGAVATHAGLASPHADIGTNTAARHTQGTDQGLDTGGGNAVTVAAVKAAVDAVGALTLIDTTDARLSDARTPSIPAPYLVTGGTLVHDGTRYANGFKDPADNTVHAIWTPQDVGAGSIAKSSGVTTITVPAAQESDFVVGNYTSARLEMTLLPYRNWEAWVHCTHDGAVEDQGGTLGAYFTGVEGNFFLTQEVYDGGALAAVARRGNNTTVASVGGAAAAWLKLAHYGGVMYYSYAHAAIGAEPAEGGWTELGQYEYSPAWAPRSMVLFIGALSFTTKPGCTIEFGQVTLRYT